MEKFNREKTLKNIERRKNRNSYIKYGTFVFAICIGVFSITYIAYSKFVTTSTINVSELVVEEFTQPTLKMAAYLDGEYIKGSSLIDGFPEQDTTYKVDKVECTNNVTGEFNVSTWKLSVSDNTIKTKCTVYFVTKTESNEDSSSTQTETESTSTEDSTVSDNTESQEETSSEEIANEEETTNTSETTTPTE